MNEYWPIVVIVLQLIFLEGILSIDNAAVIGALVTPLPDNQEIPWPAALQKLGKRLNPFLGNQRLAALRVGLLGAYLGRGAMLFLTSFLIHNSWIKLIGAVYLIHLAFDNLEDMTSGDSDEDGEIKPIKVQTFWATVLTVEIMDLIFSIDNVVAAVSLSDMIWVVMLGVGIGILTMRFAAGIFSYAVEREPILKQAAYILVLNIGVELILDQIWHVEIPDLLRFGISVATILLALAYAHIPFLQKFRFVLIWLAQGIGIINKLVDWIFLPFKGLFNLIVGLFMRPFKPQPAE
ncbi:MAG: tellurium resistance protein TerC [Anaerolineales bacterium]|nr:tellurium resistance protein TerC [Anaerolineales bacterium]